MDWIERIRPVFMEVSQESGFRVAHDTHYDARNFVFSVVKGNEIHRLDFQPMESGEIQITKLTDKYPAFPLLFLFLQNMVPLFPNIAKVTYERIGALDPPFESPGFKGKVLGMVKNAL